MKHSSPTMEFLAAILLLVVLSTASCNKNVPEPVPNTFPVPTGTSIGGLLANDTGLSLMRAAVVRAGMMTQLQDDTRTFTLFAPDNAAFALSGIRTAADIEAMPMTTLVPFVQYHISPQKLTSPMIPSDMVNLPYPSTLNPSPTTSPLFRLPLHPSRMNGFWVNSVSVNSADMQAANGTVHRLSGVLAHPSRTLWDRINTDPDLTYLKAAIQRADSGYAANSSQSFVRLLSGIGPNFTFFAPNDKAFQTMWKRILYFHFVSLGYHPATALEMAELFASTPYVFTGSGFLLSAKSIRELISYHIYTDRVYVNNFPVLPSPPVYRPTLLNSMVPSHPGLGIQAVVFSQSLGGMVHGMGRNTASIVGNSAHDPMGSRDQNFLNGVMHKIDAVMDSK